MSNGVLNILYLCADSGVSYWGKKGGSIHMREIVKSLAQKGCNLTVIAKKISKYKDENLNYATHDLPEPANGRIFSLLDDLFKDDRLKREFTDFHRNVEIENLLEKIYTDIGFDIIYERYSLFNISALRFARGHGVPHVLEVNAPLVKEAAEYRHLGLSKIARAVEKYLFDHSYHIIAVSEELKKYIINITPGARVTVVPNGVSADHFSVSENQATVGNDGKILIGFLGSLKPWHGVEILIDTFAELSRDNDDYSLLIIGDNKKSNRDLEKKCEDLKIQSKVKFTGAVEHEIIPEMLQRADVLVAPYPEMDNFYFSALKLFEYMAAGKAIVASDIGQIPKILTHEKNALLTKPGDKNSLRNALNRLKDDPGLRRRLGEKARVEARTRHTWTKRADKIMEVMNVLTRREGP